MTHVVSILTTGALAGFGTQAGWEYVGWLWALFVLVLLLASLSVRAEKSGEYRNLREG